MNYYFIQDYQHYFIQDYFIQDYNFIQYFIIILSNIIHYFIQYYHFIQYYNNYFIHCY